MKKSYDLLSGKNNGSFIASRWLFILVYVINLLGNKFNELFDTIQRN